LKLTVGLDTQSGQAHVADAIVNSLGLELPRRLQVAFFEVVQRHARETSDEISHKALAQLFRSTYDYRDSPDHNARFSMKSFKLNELEGGRRELTGEFVLDGQTVQISGQGNGPLSSLLSALHTRIEGTLSIREYSEHSLGEGSEVGAASYVDLVYEVEGSKKRDTWGVSADTDITQSGLNAILSAVGRLQVKMRV
jgi:2-isopropylmalate synthase